MQSDFHIDILSTLLKNHYVGQHALNTENCNHDVMTQLERPTIIQHANILAFSSAIIMVMKMDSRILSP